MDYLTLCDKLAGADVIDIDIDIDNYACILPSEQATCRKARPFQTLACTRLTVYDYARWSPCKSVPARRNTPTPTCREGEPRYQLFV